MNTAEDGNLSRQLQHQADGRELMTDCIQVTGHAGIIQPIGRDRLWKKCIHRNRNETSIYQSFSSDPSMSSLIPQFYMEVDHQGHYYLEMENVLQHFENPSIMDIKMGTRTYEEAELMNSRPSAYFYKKMTSIDPDEPTQAEHEQQAITKHRYMQFRESLSSSSTLGFRIDAFKLWDENEIRNNFQRMKSTDKVTENLKEFLGSRGSSDRLLDKLKHVKEKLEASHAFPRHELIGSSLLVVYDRNRTGVWMIDFLHTRPLTDGRCLTHLIPWQRGNHEDGYLFGLNNLIQVVESLQF